MLGELAQQTSAGSDAARRLAQARDRVQVEDLTRELRALSTAQEWAGVLAAADQIRVVNPSWTDPEGLTTAARRAVAERDLADRYAAGVRAFAAEQYAEAAAILDAVRAEQPDFRDVATLLPLALQRGPSQPASSDGRPAALPVSVPSTLDGGEAPARDEPPEDRWVLPPEAAVRRHPPAQAVVASAKRPVAETDHGLVAGLAVALLSMLTLSLVLESGGPVVVMVLGLLVAIGLAVLDGTRIERAKAGAFAAACWRTPLAGTLMLIPVLWIGRLIHDATDHDTTFSMLTVMQVVVGAAVYAARRRWLGALALWPAIIMSLVNAIALSGLASMVHG